ncbi:BglG family transcription antiterminator LicT [Radiobacillus deserti]|uniref:PRD domain-containing protein n=1 Tax=Radiobacillus deserti TaxID=2594883 RepID=A0A516KKP6_9BACI|nr:PRD domain-containing protein [Radiobacillus deserti]QDP41961.1 PRD domain-containing protein [Radiobacillus deserti]
MKIVKILNNNVIISKKDQEEVIVVGRGIAFNKRIGENIDKELIEKIFTLEDQDITKKFKTLIADIPVEYMELSEQIIEYAKQKLGKKLNDSIYISLTDHIHFAIERYNLNLPIRNGLLWETKNLYREEFEIGIEALNMICESFNIILPEDEAGFIALHIVNAQYDEDMSSTVDMTKVIQDVLTVVKYHYKIDFDEKSLNYHRFITHLKFFAHRLVKGEHYKNDPENELLQVIINKYPDAYECALKIKKFVEKQYRYELTDEETLYITIHVERVVKS